MISYQYRYVSRENLVATGIILEGANIQRKAQKPNRGLMGYAHYDRNYHKKVPV
jgi:hypothetical protein